MSRAPETVQAEMLALTPPGAGLPHTPESNWGAMLLPQATEIARLEGQAEQLHAEIDPRQAQFLLPEWGALFGNDPYGVSTAAFSTAQMQAYLYQRLVGRGGQSAGYYEALAAALGVTISITEYQETTYGDAVYGDEYAAYPVQFQWLVELPQTLATDAVYGSAVYGDAYGTIVPNPVQAIIEAQSPLHTQPVFSYTG